MACVLDGSHRGQRPLHCLGNLAPTSAVHGLDGKVPRTSAGWSTDTIAGPFAEHEILMQQVPTATGCVGPERHHTPGKPPPKVTFAAKLRYATCVRRTAQSKRGGTTSAKLAMVHRGDLRQKPLTGSIAQFRSRLRCHPFVAKVHTIQDSKIMYESPSRSFRRRTIVSLSPRESGRFPHSRRMIARLPPAARVCGCSWPRVCRTRRTLSSAICSASSKKPDLAQVEREVQGRGQRAEVVRAQRNPRIGAGRRGRAPAHPRNRQSCGGSPTGSGWSPASASRGRRASPRRSAPAVAAEREQHVAGLGENLLPDASWLNIMAGMDQ